MRITVNVFAALKDYFDPQFDLETEAQATIEQVFGKLAQIHPASASVLSTCRVAINEQLVTKDYRLSNEETICILPPSSGG